MTTLLRKQWIITISPFVLDCTIGYNLSVSYNTRLKYRQTMPSHSIHVHAKFHLENFNSESWYRGRHLSCTEQSLFDKSDVVRLSCRFFCNNTFENTLVRCNMMPPIRRTWPRFDIHINTLMKKLTVTLIYRCRYFPCTEQSLFDQSDVFFYNNVASFASTHSKTLQSDVTGRRQHGIRDHSSISTLMTKLLRKQWILTISPLVSDCRIGYNFSVSNK